MTNNIVRLQNKQKTLRCLSERFTTRFANDPLSVKSVYISTIDKTLAKPEEAGENWLCVDALSIPEEIVMAFLSANQQLMDYINSELDKANKKLAALNELLDND